MGNVKYLLDTHTLLWAVQKNTQLSDTAKTALSDRGVQKFVSAASAYEIMFKHQIGKLGGYSYVAENYLDVLNRLGVYELPISTRHAHYAGKFDWSHRDPFDRILAAQAFTENMVLITCDKAFETLEWVNVMW